MKTFKKIETFNDKYPLIGPIFWMVSVQYFITQLIVALDWNPAYSWSKNTISDLGNTACGPYVDRVVCSPLHNWMNASFIVLGITMIAGSSLIYHEFKKNNGSKIAFTLMAVAGAGTILVGLFPENTIGLLHFSGALMPFLLGNVGLLIFANTLDLPKRFRYYTLASAIVALVALLFFLSQQYLGLGRGGMERLVAYPQTIWLIAFGFYMSKSHFKKISKSYKRR